MVTEILSAIRALVPLPHTGYRRPDLTSRPLRFIRVRDYLIAYAPDEKPLWVIAVMHGHRSPRVMAAILRGREQDPGFFPAVLESKEYTERGAFTCWTFSARDLKTLTRGHDDNDRVPVQRPSPHERAL